jgi:hypothetical protein
VIFALSFPFANCLKVLCHYLRFIPEGVADASKIFLRDTHVLPKLVSYEAADVTGSKPIAVLLQSISGVSAINPLVAFYDIHGGKREVLFFLFCALFFLFLLLSSSYMIAGVK